MRFPFSPFTQLPSSAILSFFFGKGSPLTQPTNQGCRFFLFPWNSTGQSQFRAKFTVQIHRQSPSRHLNRETAPIARKTHRARPRARARGGRPRGPQPGEDGPGDLAGHQPHRGRADQEARVLFFSLPAWRCRSNEVQR